MPSVKQDFLLFFPRNMVLIMDTVQRHYSSRKPFWNPALFVRTTCMTTRHSYYLEYLTAIYGQQPLPFAVAVHFDVALQDCPCYNAHETYRYLCQVRNYTAKPAYFETNVTLLSPPDFLILTKTLRRCSLRCVPSTTCRRGNLDSCCAPLRRHSSRDGREMQMP